MSGHVIIGEELINNRWLSTITQVNGDYMKKKLIGLLMISSFSVFAAVKEQKITMDCISDFGIHQEVALGIKESELNGKRIVKNFHPTHQKAKYQVVFQLRREEKDLSNVYLMMRDVASLTSAGLESERFIKLSSKSLNELSESRLIKWGVYHGALNSKYSEFKCSVLNIE
jgi:hypothetical protein